MTGKPKTSIGSVLLGGTVVVISASLTLAGTTPNYNFRLFPSLANGGIIEPRSLPMGQTSAAFLRTCRYRRSKKKRPGRRP
jgi:hypothetical protein